MNTIEQTIHAVQPIADKLGQGAEQLFRIYVKQAVINGVTEITFGLIMLALYIAGLTLAIKKARKHDKEHEYDDYAVGVVIAGFLVGLILIGVSLWGIADGVSEVLNPQYSAAHNIITDVRGQANQ